MAVRPAAHEVGAQLASYHRRIRRERRWAFIAAAEVLVAIFWILAAVLHYFDMAPAGMLWVGLALTAAAPLLALLLEFLRRPSLDDTAAVIDSRLDDKQRLTTAVQLMGERERGQLAAAQLSSTAGMLVRVNPRLVYPERRPWPALALSAGLICLALGIFLLKGVLGNFEPLQAGALPPGQEQASGVPTPTPQSDLPGGEPPPGENGPQGVPGGANSSPGSEGGNAGVSPEEAARQAEASANAEEALRALGDELDGQSAAQGAADSLKQGDAEGAAQELAELGQESDQLSEQAKRELADALDRAAANSDAAPELQEAERQAADALRNGTYRDIAQAMQELGNEVRETGEQVVPQEEQARNFPTPQPGAGEQNEPGQSGQNGEQGENGEGQGEQAEPGEQGGDPGQGEQGEPGQGGQPGEQGAQGGDPGDSGSRVSGPADQQTPDVEGNPFELEADEGDPNTTRPSEPGERPGLTLEGDTGGSAGGPRQTGSRVTSPGESNRQPIERWSVIQRYFSSGE